MNKGNMCVSVRRHLGRWDRGKASPLDPWGGGGIPPGSPLELVMRYWDSSLRKNNKSKEKMIKYWTSSPKRKEKSKEKMIHYYIEI